MKPENILIFNDNQTYTIKLADFGIAKPLNPNTTQLTVSMNIQGTISWIAPEIFSGSKDHVSILANS